MRNQGWHPPNTARACPFAASARDSNDNVRVKVVCRWRPSEILAGVSDLDIFPYLKDAGCELYLNPDIHLKLYVFGSNAAFNTSANLTMRGLGYSDTPNIEIGNMVTLAVNDWENIYRVIHSSKAVDDAAYLRYKDWLAKNKLPSSDKTPFDLFDEPKQYTISSLPGTLTPDKLAEFYLTQDHSPYSPEDVRRAIHDLVAFKIPPGLNLAKFHEQLGNAFRATPFVKDFVDLLKSEKDKGLRFGAVNNWIHQKCEDVPLPYRWEIKENTRVFYDWLAHYFPEITWERPRHSQIIRWNG